MPTSGASSVTTPASEMRTLWLGSLASSWHSGTMVVRAGEVVRAQARWKGFSCRRHALGRGRRFHPGRSSSSSHRSGHIYVSLMSALLGVHAGGGVHVFLQPVVQPPLFRPDDNWTASSTRPPHPAVHTHVHTHDHTHDHDHDHVNAVWLPARTVFVRDGR